MTSELTGEEWPPPTRRRGEAGNAEKAAIGRRLKPKYDDGMSLRQIAQETGYSYGYVHTCLGHAGVKMRDRGSNKFPGRVVSL
ncbi:helix-turn-helix domain-containing protein [Streptomyces solisilvae]|uniref:helix-turn-helix domain-containing protein n=1 Tax=Streptomyces malaysiensis TaxID=92644 RepID=UPI0036B29280